MKHATVYLLLTLMFVQCDSNLSMKMEGGDKNLTPYREGGTSNIIYGTCTTWKTFYPGGPGGESYECLWTSGTWSTTGTWNWTDTDYDYTVGVDGTLTVEFINSLCNPVAGPLSTAYGVYFPPATAKLWNPQLYASTYWGYIPSSAGCWILTAECTWTGLPNSHGITVAPDWASAYDHSATVLPPPVAGICGWPLVGNPPSAFNIHGL